MWDATENKSNPEYYLKRYLIYTFANTPMTLDNYGAIKLKRQ